ncbi:MAG TPA: O-antigen ligase family protein [Pirellulales bacterium]|nr:O-antigen ligase family protein [Pirellulales bacterium]
MAVASQRAKGEERPDQLRPWLLTGATALLVARPLVVSDGGPWPGDGQPFAALWIVLAVLWALGALGRPRLAVRFTWIDAVVVAFFAWWAWCAWLGSQNGAPRPSFNRLWEGVSTLMAFFLLRQLAPIGREARALVVVMIALGMLLASSAFHQYFVTMPEDRAEFTAHPETMLQQAGIEPMAPESAEFKAFKARLESREPFATFSLTNSLAAYLAPWLILTLGVAVSGIARKPPGTVPFFGVLGKKGDCPPFRRRFSDRLTEKRVWLAAAVCAVPITGALLLTRSRSAWIAAAVGAGFVCVAPTATSANARRTRWMLVAGIAALSLACIGGLAIWRPDIVEPAFRSFRFRLEYWQSTLGMIRDHPLVGCGPGNFGEYYEFYKLPIASEEIKDPHNFLFEVAANAGLPALILLLASLAGFAWRISPLSPCGRGAGGEGSEPTNARSFGEFRYEGDAISWILGGAALGVVLGMALNHVLGFPIRLEEMIAGVLFGGVAVAIFRSWIQDGILPPSLLAIGVAVLLVALLAVGGMTFGGVAGTLWLLMALALNATDPPGARHNLPWFASLAFFAGTAALTVAQHQTGYEPVMDCDTALRAAGSAKTAEELEKQLRIATAADPWAIEPCRLLSRLKLQQWTQSGPPAERDRTRLNDFETFVKHWLGLNRRSSAAWLETGLEWLQVYKDVPNQQVYARKAIESLQRAAELYPNSAYIHAQLAAALEATGNRDKAQAAARDALRLDDLMLHEDKKLATDLRSQTQRLASGNK